MESAAYRNIIQQRITDTVSVQLELWPSAKGSRTNIRGHVRYQGWGVDAPLDKKNLLSDKM